MLHRVGLETVHLLGRRALLARVHIAVSVAARVTTALLAAQGTSNLGTGNTSRFRDHHGLFARVACTVLAGVELARIRVALELPLGRWALALGHDGRTHVLHEHLGLLGDA